MSTNNNLKFTVIGDALVGKTSLLYAYLERHFVYHPKLFENAPFNRIVNGKDYNLKLCDTNGEKENKKIRSLVFPDTDCFILCYSICCPSSLSNITNLWVPEVRQFSRKVPIILVGNKLDLGRTKYKHIRKKAKCIKQKIKAYALIECSARNMLHVDNVFEYAIRATEERIKKMQCKSSCVVC